MIQAFKEWCIKEWAKQSPFEKRMLVNSAPAMVFTLVVLVMIAVGAQFPLLTVGPIAAVVQLVWSAGYIAFLVWQRWRQARVDYQTKSEWREETATKALTSHFG